MRWHTWSMGPWRADQSAVAELRDRTGCYHLMLHFSQWVSFSFPLWQQHWNNFQQAAKQWSHSVCTWKFVFATSGDRNVSFKWKILLCQDLELLLNSLFIVQASVLYSALTSYYLKYNPEDCIFISLWYFGILPSPSQQAYGEEGESPSSFSSLIKHFLQMEIVTRTTHLHSLVPQTSRSHLGKVQIDRWIPSFQCLPKELQNFKWSRTPL